MFWMEERKRGAKPFPSSRYALFRIFPVNKVFVGKFNKLKFYPASLFSSAWP